ncbi:MAG: hypothetical protein AB8B78_03310 [Polaribacter sp.]
MFYKMKELKEYFSGRGQVKGYVFNQISKNNYGFIYEVKGIDTIHYEVFKRKENTMYDCISYPTNKAFGLWAWTCDNLERANEILESFKIED